MKNKLEGLKKKTTENLHNSQKNGGPRIKSEIQF